MHVPSPGGAPRHNLSPVNLFEVEAMKNIQINESCESCSEATVVCIKQFHVKTAILRFSGVNRSSSAHPSVL